MYESMYIWVYYCVYMYVCMCACMSKCKLSKLLIKPISILEYIAVMPTGSCACKCYIHLLGTYDVMLFLVIKIVQ